MTPADFTAVLVPGMVAAWLLSVVSIPVLPMLGGGIGGLKLDLFIWAEFSASDFKHWRIEIRRD